MSIGAVPSRETTKACPWWATDEVSCE